MVWIWLENRSYDQVAGSSAMPYLASLARRCGEATSYHNVSHPSLPNYLAAVSGTTGGVTSDCAPSGCPQRAPTLFAQLEARGLRWATYAAAMPGPCGLTAHRPYAPKHNPAVYYPALRDTCRAWDLPMGTPDDGPLSSALSAGALPAFVLLVPDLCDDGHDCPNGVVDRWLARWLPRLFDSPQYRAGTVAVALTWDEGNGGRPGESCARSSDPSCHVATVLASPSIRPGTTSGAWFTHYALLRTTEDLLGITDPLGLAAGSPSMRAAFGM